VINNKDCKACPLSELRSCVCNGQGNLSSKIVFVFDAPSTEDDATGKSFSGPAARKLDSILAKYGIHSSQIYRTFATRCRGNLRTVEGFRPPHFEEVQACSEYLLAEINQIKPNIIVTFGNESLWAITGNKKDKIGTFRGKEIWAPKYNCKVLPTFSIGKILRDPNSEEIVACDIERAIQSSQYSELTPVQTGNYIVLDTLEKFDSFIERMKEVTECAIDLETSGFNWQKDKIMCCSFSFAKNTGVLLPITRWIGYERDKIELKDKKIRRKGQTEIKKVEVITKETVDQFEPWWKEHQDYVMTKFKELMEREDIDWIGQNLRFDWKFFLQMGWKIAPAAYDTLLMHYLLYETAKGQRKLGMLSLNFLGKGQHKQEIEDWFAANGMADEDDRYYARVPESLLYRYGTVDSADTFQLKQIFYKMIEEQGMIDLLKKLIMPLNYTLTIAEFDGYKIDMKWLNRAKEKIKKQLEDIQKEIVASVGDINVASNKQLPKLLYETLQLPIVKQTPKGAPSTDEETLKILMENHPHPILGKNFRI
jgi:uracil-DNA glycosylase family 4